MNTTNPIVVKVGGSTLGEHDTSLRDCAALHADGYPVVLVHGGGAAVTDWQQRLGATTEWIDGLRTTTAESLEVVVAVLAGLINKRLVEQLVGLGAPAVGLSGVDNGMLRSPRSQRLGLVGETPCCNPSLLQSLLQDRRLPVVAPVGLSTDDPPQTLNINADAAAGAIAQALRADSLLYLTDVEAVLDQRGAPVPQLDAAAEQRFRAAGAIQGGMLPKLAAGRAARQGGVQVRIVDGRQPGIVRRALDHNRDPLDMSVDRSVGTALV